MNLYRSALLCGLLLLAAGPVLAADWGTVKGQVVWGPAELPVPKQINVGPNPACLKNGPIFENKFVVDKDSKGVKWVMVWLADAKKPKNPEAEIPIHPDLKGLKEKSVSLDQPCCVYEPRVIGLRVGQSLVAKNSGTIVHNVKIDGGDKNPNLNVAIQPGGQMVVPGWAPTGAGSVPVACNIHGWMRSDVRVFNHPYFVVTNDKGEFEIKNAPAGEFKLIVWHPEHGWLAGREGMPITIKAQTNGVTDVGQVKLNPQ